MNLYFEAITTLSQNPNLPPLFCDIFKDAFLPYRDPETLNLFLKQINEFTYDHSEDSGDAYEYLLSILGSQGDAGQFRTPRHIIDFIVEAVDPQKEETVCDPACGTAGFLISAFKHIIRENKDKPLTPDERKNLTKHFVGYDISPDMVRLSKVNMYLHHFSNPTIYEYDTLTSEEKWDENFDVMLANPPFMSPKGGIRPHKRFSVQANRSEVLFVDYILEHLRPNGRAGIIVPEGIIFQSANAYKTLRKLLIEDGLLAVVSLPAGVFNPYAGVKTSILLFDNGLAKKTRDILFLKIQNDGFDLGAQRREIDKNDLPQALEIIKSYKTALKDGINFELNKEQAEMAHLVAKDKIAESGDYNLIGDRYKVTVNFANQKWPMVELGEVCEIEKGTSITKAKIQNGNIPVIAGGQNPAYYHNQSNRVGETITVSSSGAYAGFVNYFEIPIFASDCITIKSKNENDLLSKYVFYFLKMKQKDIYKLQKGMGQPHVYGKDLAKIKIPLPPIEVQKEIVEQIEVKQKAIDAAKAVIENLEKERRYFDQEIGKIKGVEWVELKNKDLFKIESGGTPSTKEPEYWNGTINWATLRDLPQGNYITKVESTERKITEKGLAKSSAVMLPVDTILVSSRATIGRVAITKKPTATNQGFKNIIVINKQSILPYFVAMCMTTKVNEMNKMAAGGTFREISKSKFECLKIPLPPLEVQNNSLRKWKSRKKSSKPINN
jgi:type I restriction enzyme M protein